MNIFPLFAARRLLLSVVVTLALLPQVALADLMLAPTRVVFEQNQRTAQVDLINNGTEAATYRISLVNRRMNENGELQPAETPLAGELFALSMVQFSPRQVTLQPGTSQIVRVMVRKPAELAPGEYRSHLQFQRVPESQGPIGGEAKAAEPGGIGIAIKTLVGASIPVIVRHDATSANVSLSQLELQPAAGAATQPTLSLQLERSGNRSAYGDLAISFAPQGGSEQIVGRASGVAVYTPNASRRAKVTLEPPKGVALTRGMLRVTYRERPEAGGAVLAESSLALP
ncbi:MAG TPA: fimbria/pilus periplasmic chaperone [Telluria sp.]